MINLSRHLILLSACLSSAGGAGKHEGACQPANHSLRAAQEPLTAVGRKTPKRITLDDDPDDERGLKPSETKFNFDSELHWTARSVHLKSDFIVHFLGASPCNDPADAKNKNDFAGDTRSSAKCEINVRGHKLYPYRIEVPHDTTMQVIANGIASCKGCVIETVP